MRRTLYLIDGHAQIYRAYYAPMGDLTSPSGEPTRATHVFCQMLLNLLRDRRPDYLVMVMDVAGPTFRHEIDAEYKATRDAPPEDFTPQLERIVSILEAMRIPILRRPGFEADDLMATLARRFKSEVDVCLISSDKDLEQLLDVHVTLYDPRKDRTLGPAELEAEKGYDPSKAIEIQTLTGDSTDNIPGIKGVGPKTAVKLIGKYGTADAVLEHADELTSGMAVNVRAYADQLPRTRELVTLRDDVEIDFALDSASPSNFDLGAALPIFAELGFNRLTTQLEDQAGEPSAPADREESAAGNQGDASEKPAGAQPAMGSADDGDYRLIDDETKFKAFLEALRAQPVFALDTETTDLNPIRAELVGLSFSWQAGQGYYLPVRSALGQRLDRDQTLAALRPILEDPSIGKCGQNIKYDLVVLGNAGVNVAGVEFDSLLASFVLDATRRSHGLDHLARELLGYEMIPISDVIGKGKDQITIDQAEPQLVAEYAAEDADITWRLRELMAPQLREAGLETLYRQTELPLVPVLAEMEANGVAITTDVLGAMSNRLGDRLLELTREIHKDAEHEFNIDSPKQLANVLFDELGLRVVRKTKTGRSTDADTLSTLAFESDHPLPKRVLEYRELAKLKSTYVDALPEFVCEQTGRIHASFNQTGAVTGRLSSSHPNLQNIPIRTETGREIRRAFVAGDADHVLVTADYSQIELRVLAHFCADPRLLEAFRNDRDIHAAVAAQVFSTPLEAVTSEQRSRAKAVNFGIIYGQGPFGLARQTGMSQSEARKFIDAYFAGYPGIRTFIDQCIETAKRDGHVETILGRRRRIPEIASRNRQTAELGKRLAVNTVVQGSAADLIKIAMINIHQRIHAEGRPTRMLIQVHDELVFEVPRDTVEAEADMIRDEMVGAMQLDVPLKVDLAWGDNWLDSK